VYALAGTSTFQQIGLLEEALTWKPRLVVLGVCLNDTEDWANPKELDRWREKLLPRVPDRWLARVLSFSRALNWIYTHAQAAEAQRTDLRYYRRLYNPSYSGFHRFCEALEIMNDKCGQTDAVLIPTIFPLLSDTFREGHYPYEYVHVAIRGRCEELHIPCLDLLPIFRGASPARVQVIPGFDPHPNEIAHRMAAEALLRFLLDRGFVEPAYKPPERASEMNLRRIWERTIQRVQDPLSEAIAGGPVISPVGQVIGQGADDPAAGGRGEQRARHDPHGLGQMPAVQNEHHGQRQP
jgi:hypothetical protein